MSQTSDGFAEQEKVAADQKQEIDPEATPAREPATKWVGDQHDEIVGGGD